MYVIITYDLPLEEHPAVFRILNQRLNRLQCSVFAGHMSQQEARELMKDLEAMLDQGACLMWVFDRAAEPHLIGTQKDMETNFL